MREGRRSMITMYGVYLAFAITSLREVDIAQMQNTSNDREHSIGFVLVECQQPVRSNHQSQDTQAERS